MKKILSSPIAGEIPRLQTILESAGIPCVLRNEISSGLSPEIPIAESTPELWILDDQRLAEALQIKADFQASLTAVGDDWQCEKCGEVSEAQFASCWKCGAVKEAQIPVEWIERKETPPAPIQKEIVEEVAGGAPCVACAKRIAVETKCCPFCGWTQP